MMLTQDTAQPSVSFIEEGIIEIFGDLLTSRQVNLALPLDVFKQQTALNFGHDEADGLFIRAGRAGFHYWMDQYAEALGWKQADFKLLPPPLRTRRALSDLLGWFKNEGILEAELAYSSEYWIVRRSGMTHPEGGLDCSYLIGMLQELVSWAGGGKFFPACEEQCQASGAEYCMFKVNRLPAN
jgi:hypothetical protein